MKTNIQSKVMAIVMVIFMLALVTAGCAEIREQPSQSACVPHAHNWDANCAICHKNWNLIAMHDASSDEYNSDCMLCHGDMQCGITLNAAVPEIHVRMTKYILQATNTTKITDTTCIYCHKTVDFINYSAGNIRRQVATEVCDQCHGPEGPGKPLYMN